MVATLLSLFTSCVYWYYPIYIVKIAIVIVPIHIYHQFLDGPDPFQKMLFRVSLFGFLFSEKCGNHGVCYLVTVVPCSFSQGSIFHQVTL